MEDVEFDMQAVIASKSTMIGKLERSRKMYRRLCISIISLCFGMVTHAGAEETNTEEVLSIVSQLSSLHKSLEGKTITTIGAIGTYIGDSLYFVNQYGRFSVQFDAGRSARKKIEGCEVNMWDWNDSNCVYEVDAEIAIEENYSFADGGEFKLIVYNVRE